MIMNFSEFIKPTKRKLVVTIAMFIAYFIAAEIFSSVFGGASMGSLTAMFLTALTQPAIMVLIPETRNLWIINVLMLVYWYFISSTLIYIHERIHAAPAAKKKGGKK
jgi:hypothetical protein